MSDTNGGPQPPLRAGIIGCGNITVRGHAPALLDLDGVRVTAIADPVEANLRQAQALLGLPDSACFADHKALLAAGVDYVTLTVPQKFRRAIVENCAGAGVHVLTEKPLAITPADGQAMIERMRAANLRFGMVHNYLYYPEFLLARRLIDSGAIGVCRHVALNFLGMPDNPGAAGYRPQWRHDPAEAGGGILMDMVHAVYLSEYFLGGPLVSATAVVDNLDHAGDGVEDFTLVTYSGGTGYASVNMWWGGGPGGVEISGSEGRILIFYENYGVGPFTPLMSFTLVNREGRREFEPRSESFSLDGADRLALTSTFAAVQRDFAQAVRAGADPPNSAEAGRRMLEAVLAAYAAAALERAVALPLSPSDAIYQRGIHGLRELELPAGSLPRRRGLFGL